MLPVVIATRASSACAPQRRDVASTTLAWWFPFQPIVVVKVDSTAYLDVSSIPRHQLENNGATLSIIKIIVTRIADAILPTCRFRFGIM
jgi:hypothetical protein